MAFQLPNPLAFWSVVFRSRGDRGIENYNTYTWGKALGCASEGLEWDSIFVKPSWDKKEIMKIPLRKKKNQNERGSVYIWRNQKSGMGRYICEAELGQK